MHRWDVSLTRCVGEGILDETLIVITADHAAQTGRPFLGRLDGPLTAGGIRCDSVNGSSGLRSDCNWYYGQDADDETYRDPSPAVAALRAALTPPGGDPVAGHEPGLLIPGRARGGLAEGQLGGAQASGGGRGAQHARGDRHLPPQRRPEPLSPVRHQPHGERRAALVPRSAQGSWTRWRPLRPGVVALLETDVTYGVMGDHGGHNRLVQNIPMVFSGPGWAPRTPRRSCG